ncbi:MAG: hypothetical protein PVH65_01420, partial [Chloroflexota bacterium]
MGEKNAFPVLQCARPRTIQRIVWSVLGFLAFVSAMAVAIPAAAQDDAFPKIKLTARAGYDGYYKNDFWVPVRVSVSNDGPAVQGYLQIVTGDAGGNDRVVYRSPISLPTSSNKGQTLYVHLSNFASELVVELIDASDDVIVSAETNRLTGLATDSLLYAVVTRVPGRLGYLEDVMGGRSEAAVAYLSLAELPDVPAALNALDVVIFDDVDTGQLAIGQREALESWLDTGGTLVFTGGVDWQETTAGLD